MALTDDWIKAIADSCDEGQEPSEYLLALARSIESAACAERDALIAKQRARIAELTTERDEWKREAMHGGNAQYLREKVADLERQLAEARKDAERIDWLSSSKSSHGFCHTMYGEYLFYAHQLDGFPTVREVIDNAMQKD